MDPQMGQPAKVPLSPDDRAQWTDAINKARQARQHVEQWWTANLKKYAPDQTGDPATYGDDINTNRDFTLVERKKADLFYQRPDVTAVASPLLADHPELLETHTQILNEKLGPDGVDAEDLVDRVLFDILCPAGTGWTIMGYESATVDVQTQVPDGEQPMPGSVLGLQSVPKTKTVNAPVPVFENCFWSHFSPKQGLAPHNARTTKSDTWPWIGQEFEIPVKVAKRKGWVTDKVSGQAASPELHFDHGGVTGGDDVVRGVLIFYLSSLYRDDRPHPLHQTMLILLDGVDEPAEHKDSKYQDIDPKTGKLTPDSLIGYPIHPFTIRVLTDSAFVPSDCTISRPLVNELNRFREQMLEQRDANTMRWMYNVDTLPKDALEKIVRSPIGGMIGVPGDAFIGEGAFKELPHGTFPRENFQFNDYLDNDLARTHAIDAEQSGASGTGDQTATESQIKQNNVNARLGKERGRFLSQYLAGVTKYSSILQRLLPIEDAAAIVGQQKAAEWDSWRKQVPASLAFTALPDSSQRTDLAVDRKRAMDEYTFFAQDPFINRLELLKTLMPKLRYPAKVVNEQPPAKGPEPGRNSFAFSGVDLNPLAPQFAIVMEILKQDGFTISPQALQEAQGAAQNALMAGQAMPSQATGQGQPPANDQHGGKVAQLESLSKHANALTGHLQGTGAETPMGPGGSIQ